MKRLLLALTVLLALIFSGCVNLPPVSPYQSRHGVEIRGEVTEDRVKQIDDALDVFPPDVVRRIPSISIQKDSTHFSGNFIGHCHWFGRHICILGSDFDWAYIIWHEVGHCHHYYLNNRNSDFTRCWKRLAGDVYDKSDRLEKTYPSDGVLTSYGASNIDEDIAEWVQEVQLFSRNRSTCLGSLKDSGELRNPDNVYHKKLRLLYEYGFIRSENYEKILH